MEASPPARRAVPLPLGRRWAATLVVCLGLFLLGLDLTVLNVALPSLEDDLEPGVTALHWIVDGYALVLGGTVLTTGAITDRVGRRRSFVTGLAVCGIASALGALAPAPWQVIVSRCVTGAGASFLMPATLALICHLFPEPPLRRRAIAVWTAVGGAGGLTGPVVGGWLVEQFSWRAAFWLNIPLAATAIALALWLVPESHGERTDPLDIPGALLAATGLLALVAAIIESPQLGWGSPPVLTGYGLAAALLLAFLLHEHRARHPLLPLALLRDPRVGLNAATLALMSFSLLGALFVMTLYLQGVLGHTPWQAGLHTLPLPAALAAGAAVSQPVTARADEKTAVLLGLVLVTSAFTVLATTGTTSGYGHLVVFQALAGLGAGVALSPATAAVMGAVPHHSSGLGSAINDATRQVGAALGVAVQGSVLATTYTTHARNNLIGSGLPPPVRDAAADNILIAAATLPRLPAAQRPGLADAVTDAFITGLTRTAAIAGAVVLATAVAVSWRYPAHRAGT
ncbi:MFS transporter [Streptomyces sp. UNOB3_S3]|nr:MFS transporter [Streptomyces sp. UNOB3_S3]